MRVKQKSNQEFQGLSNKEVKLRLKRDGYNELPADRGRNFFIVIIGVLKEPMLLLLVVSSLIYFIFGELRDAIFLSFAVIGVVGITIYQERKTERALQALKDLSSPKSLVIREGQKIFIPSRELVRDDLLVLNEGDQITADGVILEVSNLMVDESLLTGESLAVRKSVWDGKIKLEHPGGEDSPFVFSGTMVNRGRALVRVTSTGLGTEIGKIGRSLQAIKEENTLLQKEMARVIRIFAVLGASSSLLVVVAYGLTRGDWVKGALAGLTLGMSALPEEFAVVLIIFLTLGAWRMSKIKVLTRRPATIETLGAATVLCVDKTGTLTGNKMELRELLIGKKIFKTIELNSNRLPQAYLKLVEYSFLACPLESFDPIEKEIRQQAELGSISHDHYFDDWALIQEYPLSKELLIFANLWLNKKTGRNEIYAKGAPEAIIDLCGFNKKEKDELQTKIKEMSDRGLRILAVASSVLPNKKIPENLNGCKFEFGGLIGFTDPIRANVADSLEECYRAGIRVIMITGDYPGTVLFIAREIGLKNHKKYITGQELRDLTEEQLRERIKTVNVFARIIPEQKLMIVKALKANGEIVAMTGDGVNDAPALKSAHIGIAMGENGTDVARAAADLVLLNDDFSSIVQAIRSGRKIFDNLRKAMAFIAAIHVPIAGISLLPVIFNWPLVLFPAHVAFLELIIDPACSTVFEMEKAEKDIMDRPPRNLKHPLLGQRLLFLSLLQGFSILAMVSIVYLAALNLGYEEEVIRALAFSTIVFGNLMLIITNLSHRRHFFSIITEGNKALMIILGATILSLLFTLYVPFLRQLFYFSLVSPWQLMFVLLMAVLGIVWFEGFKIVNSKKSGF